MIRKWDIHNCQWDSYCRKVDPNPPYRVCFSTPWGQLIIAYRRNSWTTVWLPFKGYTKWWSPIVWHPRSKW